MQLYSMVEFYRTYDPSLCDQSECGMKGFRVCTGSFRTPHSEMVGISYNLTSSLEFKLGNAVMLCCGALSSLLEVLMRRDNSRATRTRLDQNSTRVSSTRARARLEMLTS